MKNIQKHFTRQEISPGIILEKYQETVNRKKFYVMKIDLELFNELDFCVDFTGSSKVKLEGIEGLVSKTRVAPFNNVEVARLALDKGWVMKTKFKCFLELPSLELQREKVKPFQVEIQRLIDCTKSLENLNVACVEDRQIIDYLNSKGCNYVDHEFPPGDQAINKQADYVINNHNCIADWRRFSVLQKAVRETRKGSIIGDLSHERVNPNDVQQGKLADCWLLSVLSALVYEPKLIQRLILLKAHNELGLVKLKFWDMSKWVRVAMDDYFPCYPLSDSIFGQVENGKMWPLMIEKAFAKKYGGYTKLEGGFSKHAFIDLTNCPTFQYKFTDRQVQDWIINDELLGRIYEWKRIGYAITVSTCHSLSENQLDVYCDHSYTLINIFFEEELIQLRDPLRVKRFSGKYKQDSPLWTDDLKLKIKPVFNANTIYISFDEFLGNFDLITVCKLNRWSELICKGKFVKSLETDDEKIEHFSSRWSYKFTLNKAMKVIVGIHQADEKCPGVKETSPYLDVGIYLLQLVNGSYNLVLNEDPACERDVYLEARLEAGTYYIVPKSSGLRLLESRGNPCLSVDVDSAAFNAILSESFEKLDILDKERISKQELDVFYSYLNEKMSQAEVDEILQPLHTEFPYLDKNKYDKKAFALLFKEMFSRYPPSSHQRFFEQLGYNNELLSVRSRPFGLTVHSQEDIEMVTDDALKNGIDQTTLKLILKKHGLNASTEEKINLMAESVSLCYYINE